MELGFDGMQWPQEAAEQEDSARQMEAAGDRFDEREVDDDDEDEEEDARVESHGGGGSAAAAEIAVWRPQSSASSSSSSSSLRSKSSKSSSRGGRRSNSATAKQGRRRAAGDSGVIGQLYSVQSDKKRIEQDCQMLENRIKLLQLEEAKVARKISETKQQTQTVKQWREVRMKESQEQRQRRESLAPATTGRRVSNSVQKQLHRATRDRTKQRILDAKRQLAQQVKSEKVDIRSELVKQRRQGEKQIADKRERIMQQKALVKERKKEEEEARQAAVREELRNRLQGEERDKAKREKQLRKLERLEQEHIRRLRSKQAQQKDTRLGLAKALSQ